MPRTSPFRSRSATHVSIAGRKETKRLACAASRAGSASARKASARPARQAASNRSTCSLLAINASSLTLRRTRPGWSASLGSRRQPLDGHGVALLERGLERREGGDPRDGLGMATTEVSGIVAVGQKRIVPGGGQLGILLIEGQCGRDAAQGEQQVAAANGEVAPGGDHRVGRPGAVGGRPRQQPRSPGPTAAWLPVPNRARPTRRFARERCATRSFRPAPYPGGRAWAASMTAFSRPVP